MQIDYSPVLRQVMERRQLQAPDILEAVDRIAPGAFSRRALNYWLAEPDAADSRRLGVSNLALILVALHSSQRLKASDLRAYQDLLLQIARAGRVSRLAGAQELSSGALAAFDAGLRAHERRLRRRHGLKPPSLLGRDLSSVRVGLPGFSPAPAKS